MEAEETWDGVVKEADLRAFIIELRQEAIQYQAKATKILNESATVPMIAVGAEENLKAARNNLLAADYLEVWLDYYEFGKRDAE